MRPQAVIKTLLITDLVNSTEVVEQLGDNRAAEVTTRHDRLARNLLARFNGREIDKTDGFLLLFERPLDAVGYALLYHRTLGDLSVEEGVQMRARVGIHLGEVLLRENPPEDVARGAKPVEVMGLAKPLTARLTSLASSRQTLMTQGAFDLARQAAAAERFFEEPLRWLAHGPYVFKGIAEAVPVFEVGMEGSAPFTVPPDSEKARRAVAADDELTLGWRPAAGVEIPRRPNWILKERLGEGGFGEVWRAAHRATAESRAFKFCYKADRLRALEREVTLFRLLKDTLGNRDDIARIVDWNFEEAPYFLETEYTAGGNLIDWAEEQGGLREVPLGVRLELVAQVGEALAAAHSVGVLHKDVKPANVLIWTAADGQPRARLTDFGIGRVMDPAALLARGITVIGMTEVSSVGTTPTSGTRLYTAPELLEGKPASVQADIYALGVLVYQVVVGDLAKALAPGWRRDVADELLAEDIASFVDGSPERRSRSALEVSDRLRRLEERRESRERERRERKAFVEAQRRRRLATTIAAVATSVLLAVSILAYQALVARRLADQRRQQAEHLITFMLTDLRKKLVEVGRLEILDDVGDKALEYFASVSEDSLTDTEILYRSEALSHIGRVRLAEGRPADAKAAFEESLALARRLVEMDPENVEWKKRLGQEQFWNGRVLWDQGDTAGALALFQAQYEIAVENSKNDPDDPELQMDVAHALNNIGFSREEKGDVEGALEAYRGALAITQPCVAKAPEDTELRLDEAQTHNTIGSALVKLGDLPAALEHHRAELAIKESLCREAPENVPFKRDLAISHNYVGQLLQAMGEWDEAQQHFTEALQIAETLVATDRDNTDWQRELAIAQRRVGLGSLARGDPATAETRMNASRQILARLVEKDPTHVQWRRDLAATHLGIGYVLEEKGEASAAREQARAVLALLEPLVEQNPGDRRSVRSLSEAYILLGRVSARLGETEPAQSAWKRALEAIEPVAAGSNDGSLLIPFAQALHSLGRRAEARAIVDKLRSQGYAYSVKALDASEYSVKNREGGPDE